MIRRKVCSKYYLKGSVSEGFPQNNFTISEMLFVTFNSDGYLIYNKKVKLLHHTQQVRPHFKDQSGKDV
jgi:hypothetical protein